MVGDQNAKMIQYGTNQRLWYAIGNDYNAKVTMTMRNGKEKTIQSVPVPKPLLSKEEGKISYLFVYPDDSKQFSPYSHPENDLRDLISHAEIRKLDSVQNRYPSLGVIEAPYYLFFDTEGILLETSDKEEVDAFIQNLVEQRGEGE